ncbi:DeoR/GlpR family DNA-binding transcription regulator [Sporosalibacterium faouarense]|uniref:DeoR/GlpR family DNA-binding transcription regulator n=1 Tax=Sporosalibacterium faouarense TaxID=516123 RepID=UPI00141D67B1|nr:DeoR/GlpR family DNA-binding transcription regulator [Sporosalibacterium faouarense]MTI47538.1 DeoR/GlpR transcriptional regulator [Bacillota bacterium]
MFAKERLDKIVQILTREGKVVVKKLSEKFEVSEDAIRKDLKILENEGILERTYGGGILKKKFPQLIKVNERKKYNYAAKNKIAEKAFSTLESGETIFLDISSTNMILAEKIANSNIKLTVITNSIDILPILCNNKDISIICPGGILYQEMEGFVGSATIESISKYTVQKSFIGSCGIDLANKSVTTISVEDGNTKKAIIRSSKEVLLVMENRKFFYDGIYRFADVTDIDTIITEEKPSEAILESLKKYRVKLL